MHADVKQEYLGLGVAKMVRNKLGQTLELCVELALGILLVRPVISENLLSTFIFNMYNI